MRTSIKNSTTNRTYTITKWVFFITLVLCMLLFAKLNAQNWKQIGTNLEGWELGSAYGTEICLSADGSIMAVAAPGVVQNNHFTSEMYGVITTYRYNGKAWSLLGDIIVARDANEQFGFSIDLSADGKLLVVGMPNASSDMGDNVGKVQAYEFYNNAWRPKGGLLAGKQVGQNFGYAVAISGDGRRIAVGAPGIDCNECIGYVEVFEWNSAIVLPVGTYNKKPGSFRATGWNLVGEPLITNLNWVFFGKQVDLNYTGDRLALSELGLDNYGEIKVYNLVANKWIKHGRSINASAPITLKGTTFDLSSDGNTIAIGTPLNSEFAELAGRVEVYTYTKMSWVKKGETLFGEMEFDFFGYDLSIDNGGNYLAIGAPYFNPTVLVNGTLVTIYTPEVGGYVKTFKWKPDKSYANTPGDFVNNTGKWELIGSKLAGKQRTDCFGEEVKLSANHKVLASGAPMACPGEEDQLGYVFTYVLEGEKNTINNIGANDTPFDDNGNNIITELPTPIMKRAFPNPTKGELVLDLEPAYNALTLNVYNIDGTLQYTQRVEATDRVETYITGKPGIYLVELVNENGECSVVRVVKE